MLRKKFTGAANAVTQTLTAIRNEIKIMTDPGDIIEILKEGYLNALENMCSTLDYSNNIQIMSRMTKKLAAQQNKYKEKKNGKVDIFEGVEKLSTEFISRLRKFEFEQIQDQQKIMEVTTDQEAIQEAILKELSSYEEKNKAKFGTLAAELNYVRFFQEKNADFRKKQMNVQKQRQSGIQLTSDEIKLKVLNKIDEIFRTQEKILLHTTIGFDFE